MKNKIEISLICLITLVVLFGREVNADCLMMPNLLGKIQKTETETNMLYEYSCNECAVCAVNDKSGCWDGKIGKCLFDTESKVSTDYRSVAIKNKQVCGPIDEWLLQSLKNWKYIVLPPEIMEDGDILLSVGGCGTPNPSEIFLYNKSGELKYAHIKHWRTTPKNIDKITILPQKKNKISCTDLICTYSAEFEINGEKIILEPNQVFQGENFTLKYLGSSFAENARKEDFLDHFDYEVYFKNTQPGGGVGLTGVSQPGLDKTKYLPLALIIASILVLGGIVFFLKFKSRKKS